jgi:hypothetical protein
MDRRGATLTYISATGNFKLICICNIAVFLSMQYMVDRELKLCSVYRHVSVNAIYGRSLF